MTLRAKCLTGLAALALVLAAQPTAETEAPLAVRASVWGQVARPGQYTLSGSPDLFDLLSVAGGPTSGAEVSRIQLFREQDGTRHRLNLYAVARSGQPFFVRPGDVIVVPESFWSGFNRSLPVISTLAVVANLAVTITLMAQK